MAHLLTPTWGGGVFLCQNITLFVSCWLLLATEVCICNLLTLCLTRAYCLPSDFSCDKFVSTDKCWRRKCTVTISLACLIKYVKVYYVNESGFRVTKTSGFTLTHVHRRLEIYSYRYSSLKNNSNITATHNHNSL